MAANDYYHSFKPSDPTHGPANPSTSHLPQESYTTYNPHTTYNDSPYNTSPQSPQGDFSYKPYSHTTPGSSTPLNASGALVSGGRDDHRTSYADDVPLRPHPSKKDSDKVYHNHYGDDPAIEDRLPPKKKKKKGFLARTPWVVYSLTLIQVIVFIVELAKNGKNARKSFIDSYANKLQAP